LAFIQNNASYFIADQVFPNVPVDKQSGLYLEYDRSYWLRDEAQERAPATQSAGGGYAVDFNPNYYCHVYAYHKDIDDQIRANSRGYMDMDRDATQFVTRKMLIKRDAVWAANYFQAGIWTTDLTGTTGAPDATHFKKWSQAGSTPVEDILGNAITIAQLTGFKPNVAVATPDVYNTLRNHPEILDRIKFTQRGIVAQDLLAELFEVDKFLVAWGIKNTAAEGATAAYSFIMGSAKLWLGYAAPSAGLLTPSAGYTFSWAGYLGSNQFGTSIQAFRMQEIRSDRVEGEMAFDMKLVSADLGAMFSSAV
jgi:hypothetical protein